MNNFFADKSSFNNNQIELTGDNYKHISKVLRMSVNEKISVCNTDTNIRYIANIEEIDSQKIKCQILEECPSNEMNIKVTLFQGLPKSDKMELIIQKTVELGVNKIVPLEMKNCIVKVKDIDKKTNRWQAISESAAKQSIRNIIPKVENIKNIKNIKEELKNYDLVLVAYEKEEKNKLKNILKDYNKIENIAVIIGPEGGISEEEITMLQESKAISVSLGKRILRTETAPITILSMINYQYE